MCRMCLQRLCKQGTEWPEKLRAREAASVNLLGMVVLAKDEAHRSHTLPTLCLQHSTAPADTALSENSLKGCTRTSTCAAEPVDDRDSDADHAAYFFMDGGSTGC